MQDFLARLDKKDATLKMVKLLIYQGFSEILEMFFNVFSEFEGLFVKTKELTKKMPFYT